MHVTEFDAEQAAARHDPARIGKARLDIGARGLGKRGSGGDLEPALADPGSGERQKSGYGQYQADACDRAVFQAEWRQALRPADRSILCLHGQARTSSWYMDESSETIITATSRLDTSGGDKVASIEP